MIYGNVTRVGKNQDLWVSGYLLLTLFECIIYILHNKYYLHISKKKKEWGRAHLLVFIKVKNTFVMESLRVLGIPCLRPEYVPKNHKQLSGTYLIMHQKIKQIEVLIIN